jgi:hypothetical protein
MGNTNRGREFGEDHTAALISGEQRPPRLGQRCGMAQFGGGGSAEHTPKRLLSGSRLRVIGYAFGGQVVELRGRLFKRGMNA